MSSTPPIHRALIFAAVLLLAAIVGTQAQAQEKVQATKSQSTSLAEPDRSFDLIFDMRVLAQYPQDDSFDALSETNTLNNLQLGFGHALDGVFPGLRGYFLYETSLHTTPNLFNESIETSWSQNYFMLAAEWGPTLWDFFRPYARLAGGYALQSFSVDLGDTLLGDYTHDVAFSGSLGFEGFFKLGQVGGADFYGAVITEVGYRGQTVAEFDELTPEDDDSAFPTEAVNLGELHTNGVFWDLGIGIRMAF